MIRVVHCKNPDLKKIIYKVTVACFDLICPISCVMKNNLFQ